jgi:DNA-binding CsgD family transcriptional regulator
MDSKDTLTTKRQPIPAAGSAQTATRATGAIKKNQDPYMHGRGTRIEQAEMRTERAEARAEQAKTRTAQAETRTEEAETRTDLAKTRTEQAEIRTERAETRTEMAELRTEEAERTLQRVVSKEVHPSPEISTRLLKKIPLQAIAGGKSPLGQLTSRQREILQLIAEGQNTKRIAEILKISPKTVEYHRLKLMNCLNIHDVAGLVRFAMRSGLLPQENLPKARNLMGD